MATFLPNTFDAVFKSDLIASRLLGPKLMIWIGYVKCTMLLLNAVNDGAPIIAQGGTRLRGSVTTCRPVVVARNADRSSSA